MNTKDKWTITATIHDEQRRALWSEVFPDGVVPIQVPVAYDVNVPELGNIKAYMLDLAAISDEQREKVIDVISKRFSYPRDEVGAELDKGVPILADGVSVLVKDMAYFSARDLDELFSDLNVDDD